MNGLIPETSGSTVVINGSFNPAIFQPQWFVKQGLLAEGEGDSAEVEIIHQQIAQFKTERFFIQVTPENLLIGSNPSVISEPARDIAVGILFILEHTPVTQMGINRMMHFDVPTIDSWHRIGDQLTPKTIWEEVLPDRPGMETIVISSQAPGRPKGSKINVKVEPSRKMLHGVYFEVNNHFQCSSPDVARDEFIEILKSEWSELQDNAERIANRVIQWSESS